MEIEHIHVGADLNAGVHSRNVLASFGLVGVLPTTVATGCDQRVPRSSTSTLPEQVTCLPCRRYAHREYLRLAERTEGLSSLPGMSFTREDAGSAAARCRQLAEAFADHLR